MRIPGSKGFGRFARWLRSRFLPGALILLYHRVAEVGEDDSSDPFSLCVTPQHFSEHLAVLRHIANPISLRTMTHSLQHGDLPRRAVVITFDDGYADNLYYAKPILEQYGIPATIFVATGYIGGTFWWDELVQTIFEPETLPNELRLNVNGDYYEWQLNDTSSNSRRKLLGSLYQKIRPLGKEQRIPLLQDLHTWSDTASKVRQNHRALTTNEIVQLASSGIFEIGAHGVSHHPLNILHSQEQQKEIAQSKNDLEGILNKPVTSFSYPYGLRADFSHKTSAFVQQAGFECACTNVIDVVRSSSDLFQLPRYWVNNWNGAEFLRRINRWLRS